MANPKTTLARGLDKHERERTLAPDPLAIFKGAPTNIAALQKVAATVVGKRDRMSSLAGAILADLEKFRATKHAELADMGVVRSEGGAVTDTWGRENRNTELVKQVSARARMGRRTSEDERITIRRELAAIRDAVKATANTFSDPVSMLYSKTLDSERAAFRLRTAVAPIYGRSGP